MLIPKTTADLVPPFPSFYKGNKRNRNNGPQQRQGQSDLVNQLINDPESLAAARQFELANAAAVASSMAYQAYVASENAPNRQAERYPFVFDAMAELKAKMPVGRDANKVSV